MPILGFGVYQITGSAECKQAVYDAIMASCRLIDTAVAYNNEKAVGRAIRRSGVARGRLFITTKLWLSDVGYEPTKQVFTKSLEFLGLDYLELYLIHQLFGDIFGAWRAMEELYKERIIENIEVFDFELSVDDMICFKR